MAYLNLASCVTHHGPGHLKLFRQLCLPEVGRPLRRQVERPLHLSMTQQMALVFQGLFETHQEQFESLGTKNWGLILASAFAAGLDSSASSSRYARRSLFIRNNFCCVKLSGWT